MDRNSALLVAGGVAGGLVLAKLICAATSCCDSGAKKGGCCKKNGGCKKSGGGCKKGAAGGAGAGAGAGADSKASGKCPVTGATGKASGCPAKCSKCPYAAQMAAAVTDDPVSVHYFAARGRAEQVRLALALAGVEFEDKHYDFAAFGELRATGCLAFGSVPLLKIDGKDFVQGMATVAYVGRTRGLAPTDPVLVHRMDSMIQGCEDYRAGHVVKVGFMGTMTVDDFKAKTFPRWLGNFNKFVEANTAAFPAAANRFCVGDSITVADTTLFDVLDATNDLVPGALEAYPALNTLYNHVKSVPAIAAYLSARTSAPWKVKTADA